MVLEEHETLYLALKALREKLTLSEDAVIQWRIIHIGILMLLSEL